MTIAMNRVELYHPLKKNLEIYGSLIEGAPDSIVAVDLKGNITYCNKATEILTGYATEELVGKHFSRLVSRESEEIRYSLKFFKALRKSKKVAPFEMQVKHKTGKPHWIEVHLSRIKKGGRVTGFQINTVDITKRKQAEKALTRKGKIAAQRARLLADLRSLDRIDDILIRVCEAVRDSGLFRRVVMTLHKPGGRIVHLGQVGLPPDLIKRARQAPAIDDELKSRITSKKFRISDSFFVPIEAGLDYTKTKRYIPQKEKNSSGGDWQPGDELFVPLWSSSKEIIGYLSVDTPVDGNRPDVKTIQALEMLVEAAAARVRELEAHETLSESEEKFRTLSEQSPNMIFIHQRGRVIYVNRKCEEIMGYKREEFYAPDFDFLKLIAPEDRKLVKASLARHVRGKDVDPYESTILTKKGEKIEAILSTKLISYLGETAILGIITDITEHKKMEEALRKNEDQLRLITDALPVLISYVDSEQCYRFNNKAYEKWFGHSRTEVCGKHVEEVLGKPAYKSIKKYVERVLSGQEVTFEDIIPYKDGGTRHVNATYVPHFGKQGEVRGFFALVSDITERKRAEEALRIERERLETVTQNAGVGLAIISKDYRTLWANEVLKQLFGDVEGKICYSTYNQRTGICPRCGVREIFETGWTEVVHEQVGEGIDGNTVWSQIIATPIKDKEGKVTAALEVVVDITERKRAEGTLRESEERYRTLFEDSPISLWEEDFSEVKKFIDRLQAKGVKDVRKYFEDHQNMVANCLKRVEVIDVNNASLELFKAQSKEELQRGLANTFSEESYEAFREELISIAEGKTVFQSETITQTLKGDKKNAIVRWSVAPGHEKNLSKILVSIGDITELKRAQEQNLLLETSRALSRTLKLEQVLKIATQKMADALKPDRCSVALFDEKQDSASLKFVVTKKDTPSSLLLDKRIPPDGHFYQVKDILMTKGYLKIADVKTDPLPPSIRSYFQRTGIKSSLIIPIIMGKELFGAFHIVSEKPRNFATEEISLAQTIANQAAVALQNCRLMEDLKRKHYQISEQADLLRTQFNEQKMLFELAQALSSTLNLDQMLKFATQKVTELLKTERSSIILINPDGESATIKALYIQRKFPSPGLVGFTFDCKTFPELKKFLTRPEPLVIPDTSALLKEDPKRAYLLKQGKIKSTAAVALKSGGKLLGLLTIGTIKKVHHYTPEEIRLLQTIANSIAVAIENSLLMWSLKANYAQIDKQAQTLKKQAEVREILLKISRELSGTLDLDRILQIATKEATQALHVDRCAALLAFPEEDYAEVRSVYVKDGKSVSHILGHKIYPRDFPQAREMLEKRKSIHIPNVHHLSDKSYAKRYFINEGIKSTLFSPMVHGKKLVGFFILSTMKDFKTFTREEIRLAQTISNQVAVAIENARLLELVRRSSGDLKTLSIQLINVQEDERKKIAQELHDEIGQTLFAMKMNLEMTKKNLPANLEKFEDMKNRLTDTEYLLSQTIDRIRNLTTDLRPSMLDDFGLIPALNWYIGSFSKRTNIKVYLKTKNFKPRLSSEVETTFYRIIQEALTNVAKHAQATEVLILLALKNSNACLAVEDNGLGFDTKKVAFPKDRLGIFSIKERVGLLNGGFEIHSKPNKGTKLNVKIPLTERRV
jgi:PAS domain S-box-containing protein